MDPALASYVVAGLVFVTLAAGALVFGGDAGAAKATKRAKSVVTTSGPRRLNAVEAAGLKRKQANADALKDLNDRQKKSQARLLSVKGQIEQAGLTLSEQTFWIGSALIGATFGAVAFLANLGPLVTIGAVFAGAIGLPRWMLGFVLGARQKKFVSQFADGIDMVVRGVKSGLPLNQCLQIIATESPEPLRSEFKKVVDGQSMGVPLDQNLQRLYERMPLPEVNFFNIVLIIQQKAGGNLSEALGNLSGVLRSRKLLKEKIKALSSEAKASAMIIGALPFIVMVMVYMVRPDYIMKLFTTDPGRMILGVSAVMMTMGILVMRNMINFKH
jgi:tight adherence protein B